MTLVVIYYAKRETNCYLQKVCILFSNEHTILITVCLSSDYFAANRWSDMTMFF